LGAPIADVDLSADGKLALAAVPGIDQVVLVPCRRRGDASSFSSAWRFRAKLPRASRSRISPSWRFCTKTGADNSHLHRAPICATECSARCAPSTLKGPGQRRLRSAGRGVGHRRSKADHG